MHCTLPRGRRESDARFAGWSGLTALILIVGLFHAMPVFAEEPCGERWTIGGKGSEDPWVRVNGYRIGMTKSQAHQIRRGGLVSNIAQNTWKFDLDTARMTLEFQKGKLTSAALTLISRDFQEAYADVVEQMGPPDDFGEDYMLWRSEECDTVKILKDDGDNVVIAVQKLAKSKKKAAKKSN